jgi:hypothetical protein
MRITVLTTMAMLSLLSLSGTHNSSVSSASGSVEGFATPDVTRFTSAYTDLSKCGSGMTKKEEKEAEAQGSDIPIRCKAFGGYDLYVYYSACTAEIAAEKGEESIHVATQATILGPLLIGPVGDLFGRFIT